MKRLLDSLDINYNDIELFSTALTHPSYAHENKKAHNQRLDR